MPNLWPEDIGVGTMMPPVAILREQAEFLTRMTKGLLEGQVRTTRESTGNFRHTFYLVAPALEDYSYELFAVVHPIEFYPLHLHVEAKSSQAVDEPEFLRLLKQVFSDTRTKQVISAIIAQVDDPTASEKNSD